MVFISFGRSIPVQDALYSYWKTSKAFTSGEVKTSGKSRYMRILSGVLIKNRGSFW